MRVKLKGNVKGIREEIEINVRVNLWMRKGLIWPFLIFEF